MNSFITFAPRSSATVSGQIRRSFLVVNILIAVFFILYFLQAYFLYKRSSASQAQVMNTNEVLGNIRSADADNQRIQSSLRAFFLTHDPIYASRIKDNIIDLRKDVSNLVWFATDKKADADRMLVFSNIIEKKITLSESLIAQASAKIYIEPQALMAVNDNIERAIAKMKLTQSQLLAQQIADNKFYSKESTVFSMLSYILISIFLLIALYKIHHNIRKRSIAEEGMEAERKKHQQLVQGLINNIPSAIYVKDMDGKYILVNKKMEELSGMPAKHMIGCTDRQLTADTAKYLEIKHSDDKVLEYKKPHTIERQKELNGKSEYFLDTKFPLLDENGDIKNICGLATNITERKESELKIIDAKKEAEKARMAQETFLANMSHEIRTPMNGILGMGNLLLGTPLNEEQHEFTQNIQESAHNLLSIINDILDFSKIRSGKFRFDHVPFNVKQIVTRAIYPLRIKADEKLLRFNLHFDESIPKVIIGDPVRLQQIIINLAGNAIKFTSTGAVDVHVTGIEDNGQYALKIDVKDTGIGLPEDKLEYIFESFTQNNVNASRKYGGTGLGLAIVKQLVELQQGKIVVESTLGLGSVFTVLIPYKISNDNQLAESRGNINYSTEKNMLFGLNVLVAEDNIINQKVVRNTLQKQGANVKIVVNGKEAVEQMKDEDYDIVLMDLQMPEVDGYKATRYIRQVLKNNTPILAMTADALKGEAEKCYEAGMTGFISKPFEPNDLYLQILKVTRERIQPKLEDYKTVTMSQQLVDFSFLYEISDNDPQYICEVIDLFLGTMPDGLDKLEGLIRTTDDWDAIYKQAHFLKSSVSVVRVRDMFDNLAQIEALAKQHGNKEQIVQILDTILSTFKQAHPVVLNEKARHASA